MKTPEVSAENPKRSSGSSPICILSALICRSEMIVDMRRWRAKHWLGLAFVSFLATAYAFFTGAAAAGLDIGEKCAMAGELFSVRPGSVQYRELQQAYPMHAWCNASYDLVPAWVNPALATFAILTLAAVSCSVISAVKRPMTTST